VNGELPDEQTAEAARWNRVDADASAEFPAQLGGYAAWRKAVFDSLVPGDPAPANAYFGLKDFEGAEVVLAGASPYATRMKAYDLGLRALVEITDGAPSKGWSTFASRMAGNKVDGWTAPAYGGLASDAFLKLFTKDLIRRVFGMPSELVEPTQTALLAE